jgi:hypothetical protein
MFIEPRRFPPPWSVEEGKTRMTAAYVPRRKTIMPMRAMSAIIAAVSIGLSGGIASALRLGLCGRGTVSLGIPECSLRMAEGGP